MKYQKKPVVIEALQFNIENKDLVFDWIECDKSADYDIFGRPFLKIETLEGVMIASLGDYIIKGVEGEFYPCKQHIFEKTYEVV